MRKNLFIALAVIAGMVFSLTSCLLGTDIETLRDRASDVVNISAIEGVNVPTINGTPVDKITENAQYKGTVTWNPAVPTTGFAPNTRYTALITLTQKPGYTLDGVVNDFFTVSGAESVSYSANSYDRSSHSSQLTATFPQIAPLTPVDRIEYYWVDQHGSLVTTSGGAVSIITGSTLTISPQGTTGYTVKGWYVNGVDTGESGNSFVFNITTVGNHTVGLFVEKGGNLYNTSITIEVLTNLLTANTWADGNFLTSSDTQWFKFTATSSTQYIYASFGTLSSSNGMYVQVYTSTNSSVVSQTRLYSGNSYTSCSVSSGQTYYIKVTPYSSGTGTYQITFNSTGNPPLPSASASATQLTANTWADGSITSTGEQWFKFTATTSTHYIHASFSGTLSSSNGMYVQVYASTGSSVVSQTRLYSGGNSYAYSSSFSSGQTYYIKVTPYSGNIGTYQITFNSTGNPPLPSGSANATLLTNNTWADGNFTSSTGEQWFRFTPLSSYGQYLYVSFGTLSSSTGLYVQVYSSTGSTVVSQSRLYSYNNSNNASIYCSISSGQTYYIKVTPYNSSSTGTYKIAFSTSGVGPSGGY